MSADHDGEVARLTQLDYCDDLPGKLTVFVKSNPSRVKLAIAVGLLLAATIILFAFPFLPLTVGFPQSWSTGNCSVYLFGTAVIATAIAAFTTSQIRELWAINLSLLNDKRHTHNAKHRSETLRTVLGLGSFHDHRQSWPVSTSFLMTGLITAVIVAGVIPSTANGMKIISRVLYDFLYGSN
jgi:hypothetical protein